ncbi:MAG TPA: ribokinase [Gaiellaceae bacterium]|nr:ribokinase [Gaiellaceae bacterium]
MTRVAVVGSYGVGLTFGVDRVPDRGESVLGSLFRTDPGGKGSNQAIGAARLGAEVSLLTAVGDDAFGDDAFALWAAEDVDASAVVRAPLSTMTAAILVEETGDNRIVIVPGALSVLTAEHVDAFRPRIEDADVLLVQLEIPVATAVHALELARAAGVRTVLNPAPAPAAPLTVQADYLTPNETEAPAVAGAEGTLVVTLGERGAQLGAELVPALPARAVDTTGAGDAFCAAFAVALAEGASDLEAVRWGCAAGAHMVEHEGVVPGLPTRAELEARLALAV